MNRSALVPLTAGLAGGFLMLWALGPSLVDPRNIEWLMYGDYALHFLGWHLYRHGPWAWPLGATPNLIWPIGSSVGLTDSIPVVAVPARGFLALLAPRAPAAEIHPTRLILRCCRDLRNTKGATVRIDY